jgi:hypothetical protein
MTRPMDLVTEPMTNPFSSLLSHKNSPVLCKDFNPEIDSQNSKQYETYYTIYRMLLLASTLCL